MKHTFQILIITSCLGLSSISFGHETNPPRDHRHVNGNNNDTSEGNIQWISDGANVGAENEASSGQDRTAASTSTPLQNGCSFNQNGEITCSNEEQQSRNLSQGQACDTRLVNGRMRLDAARLVPPPNREAAKMREWGALNQGLDCRKLELASKANSEMLSAERDMAASQDRRITCIKKGGYTLDWKSCKSGLDAYNMVVVADAALNLTQQIRTSQSTQRLNNQVAEEIQSGNAQNAAYDATVQHNKNLANMNMEKAAAYTAALGLLGSKIAGWQSKSDGALGKLCGNQNVVVEPGTPEPAAQMTRIDVRVLPHIDCMTALRSIRNSSEVFANDSGKAALVAAFMEYMAKAVQAGLAAKNLSNIAKQVEQVKNGTEDLGPTMFERCSIAPNDPACLQAGPRVPGEEFTGGEISIGENFNNAFGNNLEETASVGFDSEDLTPGESVANAGNPFEDAAKEASGILEQAPAANFQPGSAPGGGGGGGAGGGLGGGGVSLGNDLKGPEAEKTAEVDAAKSSGNYNFAGGGGFQAIKAGKEDANPFASLFDSKSQGGVGEDRSFASDDIGGKDSGLFLRISRRYGKISGEKRIQATNLE